MIYLNEAFENKQEFESLLQRSSDLSLAALKTIDQPDSLSGAQFEDLVFEASVKAAEGTVFEGKLVHTDDRVFPDIVAAELFGVEVKATKKDDWSSLGNSVLESSRAKSVEKIYMFFGKLGGAPDIKFRNYEDCLKGIAVTHYPRYLIDMDLPEGESIFTKMGTTYDEVRHDKNPVRGIRSYYRGHLKEGEALWWLDDDSDKAPALSPIIKTYASLSSEGKSYYKAEAMALFPEIFSNSTTKYEKVATYWVAEHGLVSSNLRDHFTAGGQVSVSVDDETFPVPKVIKELIELSKDVKDYLSKCDETKLSNYWGKKIKNYTTSLEAWKNEIDHESAEMNLPVKLSKIFDASLSGTLKLV